MNAEYFSPNGISSELNKEDDEIDFNRRCIAIESSPIHLSSVGNLNKFSCSLELDYYCEYS